MSPTFDFSKVSVIFYKRDNEEASCDALQRMAISDVSHPEILISECEPFFPQET
jgi:hypothetical protein